jgi:cation/acetate symporter
VSGLIVAASGAVAHDLMSNYMGIKMTDKGQVKAGKISAIVVGCIAILLGILCKGMNVSFLVALAFAVAASANLPAIIMMMFWKKTTSKGIAASIVVGIVSALGIILLSPSTYADIYGLSAAQAPIPLDNPAIISMPLSLITLVVVSLLTQKRTA